MPPITTSSRSAKSSSSALFGYLLLRLGFHPAPILLGFVLGPRFEENFRRAMLISRGDLGVFVERPISAVFVGLCVLLIGSQIYFRTARLETADRALAAAARQRRSGRIRRASHAGGINPSSRINRGPILDEIGPRSVLRLSARSGRRAIRAPSTRARPIGKQSSRRPDGRLRAAAPRRTSRCAASSLKTLLAVAERRERHHQLVARIDFEDRLRRRGRAVRHRPAAFPARGRDRIRPPPGRPRCR